MATGSQIDICNRALLSIGARTTIGSLSEDSVESNSCAILYTPTFESLARTAQWGALRAQAVLSLYAAAKSTPENVNGTTLPLPPTPWLYAYIYPNNCLRVWWIVPSFPCSTGSSTPETTVNNSAPNWLPGQGQINYQISSLLDANGNPFTVILTNQDLAQAVYAANIPNPENWDSLLQQAMVASLGAYLVPALSLSLPLMQMSIKMAEQTIAVARAVDSNEGVTVMDHIPDYILARAGGSGWGPGGFYPATYGLYDTMCWPGF